MKRKYEYCPNCHLLLQEKEKETPNGDIATDEYNEAGLGTLEEIPDNQCNLRKLTSAPTTCLTTKWTANCGSIWDL